MYNQEIRSPGGSLGGRASSIAMGGARTASGVECLPQGSTGHGHGDRGVAYGVSECDRADDASSPAHEPAGKPPGSHFKASCTTPSLPRKMFRHSCERPFVDL